MIGSMSTRGRGRSLVLVAAAVLTASGLVACGSGSSGSGSSGGAGSGGGTLVIDSSFDLKTVDPGREYELTGQMLTKGMYETLLTFANNDLTKPVGDLASSYVLSPDAKTLTLTLAQGRVFSDGTPITADDVVFSLQRLIGMKGNPSFLLDGVTVSKKDDSTVVLTSATPNPALPFILPNPALSVVNSKVVKANGGTTDEKDAAEKYLNGASAGSGPYVLKSLDVASQAVLTKNPKYNGPDKPAYDTVVIRNVKAATQVLNVQKGDSQVALDLSGDQVKGLDTSKVTVTSGPSAYTIFLLLNQGAAVSPATSNPQYVSAVKKAIDYTGLLGVAGTGAVQPAGIIPSLIAGTLPASDALKQDVAGAKVRARRQRHGGPEAQARLPERPHAERPELPDARGEAAGPARRRRHHDRPGARARRHRARRLPRRQGADGALVLGAGLPGSLQLPRLRPRRPDRQARELARHRGARDQRGGHRRGRDGRHGPAGRPLPDSSSRASTPPARSSRSCSRRPTSSRRRR